jgi:hypothetical protein
MAALRKIEPLPLPPTIIRATVDGKRPVLRWIAPTELLVDGTYQRDLSRQSLRLIRHMVEVFAWNRMKPPIVVEVGSGFHVVDGQHTAIAAATIGIREIPIFVVDAPEVDERARSFVGHNTDRITVSPIAIWNALRAAGDPDAVDVANVCKRSGVRIRTLNQNNIPAEGDTMAIGRIRNLVKKRGVVRARRVLECLVKARRAPIVQEEILAADHLICELSADPDDLSAIIRIEGDKGLNAARSKAQLDRSPIWRELMARWSSRLKREAA